VFLTKPTNGTVSDLIKFILIREIMGTAQNESYSVVCYKYSTMHLRFYISCLLNTGYLQIQYLSSTIGTSIQQHAQFSYDDFYQLTLVPICCDSEQKSKIHIMWVKFKDDSISMNHICPLVPEKCVSESCKLSTYCYISRQCLHQLYFNTANINLASKYFSETCIMKVFQQCVAHELHGGKTIE